MTRIRVVLMACLTCVSTGQIPLTNPDGVGLYPDGTNTRPAAHDARGIALAQSMASSPRVVLVSIGMSVTKQAFRAFQVVERDRTAANVALVNCAAGGATSETWSDSRNWQGCFSNLADAGESPNDVQAVWMKLSRSHPTGPVEDFDTALLSEWRQTIANAKANFPNLKQIHLSSRSYGGYDDQNYNGEPYAFHTGLVAKALVTESIAGTLADYVDWGPYFWTDGLTPRFGDGLIWRIDPNPYKLKNGVLVPTYNNGDVKEDGIHQNANGEQKEVALMRAFYELDPTTCWFNARCN